MYEKFIDKILDFMLMYILIPIMIIITFGGIVVGLYCGFKYTTSNDYHTITLIENDWDCTKSYRYWSSGSKGMSSGYRAVCTEYTRKQND